MSASASQAPVLVVGGGIGGLSTALALARKGIPVQVLEQAPEFKEIGAGIQLGPNVFRMFEVLGLTEQMFHWCAFPEGPRVSRLDHRRNHRRHEDRQALPRQIPRALRRHSPRRHAQCHPRRLQEIEPDQARHLAEGGDDRGRRLERHGRRPRPARPTRASALVGCDGLWSTVREKIVGDGKPVVSGHIAYRAVLPTLGVARRNTACPR